MAVAVLAGVLCASGRPVEALQFYSGPLASALGQSPFVAIVTITEARRESDACVSHRLVVKQTLRGQAPPSEFSSDKALEVDGTYLIFDASGRRGYRRPSSADRCTGLWLTAPGEGATDVLRIENLWIDKTFADYLVIPLGSYTTEPSWHTRFRRSGVDGAGGEETLCLPSDILVPLEEIRSVTD